MKQYKILFISSWLPNRLEPFNGDFVLRHAQAVATKHHVQILHVIGDPNIKTTEVITNHQANMKQILVYFPKSKWPVLNLFKRFLAYKKAYKTLQKPDLVHANVLYNNLFFAVYLKCFHHIPFVLSEHWTAYLKHAQDAHGKLWRFFAKLIANQATIICPVSHALADGLKDLGLTKPMIMVPNVIDLGLFNLDQLMPATSFTFLHISSLCERKNPLKIIDAAVALHQINPSFKLEIGGNGDLEPLEQHIKQHKAQAYIQTFGALSITQVAQKIKQSHVFILFSDNETQGCVLMEAMACGVAVISSHVGGTAQFIKPGFGLLVPKHNTQALIQAMRQMLEAYFTKADAKTMHQCAQDNYGKTAIAKAFTEVYKKVLDV
jgi:glycosyltransferase involved in cell wall biosynthesis